MTSPQGFHVCYEVPDTLRFFLDRLVYQVDITSWAAKFPVHDDQAFLVSTLDSLRSEVR